MKKIYVESLGCAKNQVDSEILLSLARKKGYEITDSAQDADVVVINTCGFIESAKKEAIDTFFSFRNALPQAKIVTNLSFPRRMHSSAIMTFHSSLNFLISWKMLSAAHR